MQLTAPELKQVLDALTDPRFAEIRMKLGRQLSKREQDNIARTRVERVPCERCGKTVTKTRWAGYRSHDCPHQRLCTPSSASHRPACPECREAAMRQMNAARSGHLSGNPAASPRP
jgi:hypothetical protein